MNRHKFLSIGEISKMCGVHINSLRYYDNLGILRPAYIDPDTNYRYYTYSQIGIIEAIQTCVELDIPLKKYLDFTDNNGQTIHIEPLLEYGREKAEQKIKTIRKGLRHIEHLQKEIEHGKMLLKAQQPIEYSVVKKRYYTRIMAGPLKADDYKNLDQLPATAISEGYKTGMEQGLLYIFDDGQIERYQFIEIMAGPKINKQNIITIPSGRYIAKVVKEDRIENAPSEFASQFETAYKKIIIETELFTKDFDMDRPLFELRCSLSE